MRSLFLAGLIAWIAPLSLDAQSLRGSMHSLDRQQRQAQHHDYSYLHSPAQVRRFVDLGLLVRLGGSEDYRVHNVGHPYVRPEVKLFVERLSAQYRRACGEVLVVTSGTRPTSQQPRNASLRSVHPTGMAIDLRKSAHAACRNWLRRTLLELERARLIEATEEYRPPHFHVAVFPKPYGRYVASKASSAPVVVAAAEPTAPAIVAHQVRRGDTLWALARHHNTTVSTIRTHNGLRSTRIRPGQVIEIPTGR